MYRHLLKLIYGVSIVLSISAYSQNKGEKIVFSSFGTIPNTVDPKLHLELKKNTNIFTRLNLIEKIGEIHLLAGNTDSIIYYGNLLKITALKEKIPNRQVYICKANYIIGSGKLKNGLYDEAMKYFIEGIFSSPTSEMLTTYYKHQLGLGMVYLKQKQYDLVFPILKSCIKESKDKETIILAKKTIGDTYFEQKNDTKAKFYYLDALKSIPANAFSKTRIEIQLNLGRIEAFHGRNIEVIEYLAPILEEAKNNQFYDLYIEIVYHIGKAYHVLGQYESAEMILNTAYINAVQWNRLELQQKVIYILKNLYVDRKNYKNAYNLMTQYIDISNQIITNQNQKTAKELEVKYQTLQKEKEILSLKEKQLVKESEIKKEQTIKKAFFIGFLIILIPVIGLLFVYFQKLKTQIALNKSQEEVNTQKVYGLIKEQELNLIKATMEGQDNERQRLAQELHDSVGGNLASIKLQLSNTEKISEQQINIIKQIDETYNQVRDFSHNLVPKKFQKNSISTLVKEYIRNVKNGSRQNISFHPYPENLIAKIGSPLTEELFKIIQELLTNCLKHAKAKNIDIYLNHHKDAIQLLFEDDGVGFDIHKTVDGIGFKNIKNRLNHLSGGIHIDSTIGRGTVISIEIPLG